MYFDHTAWFRLNVWFPHGKIYWNLYSWENWIHCQTIRSGSIISFSVAFYFQDVASDQVWCQYFFFILSFVIELILLFPLLNISFPNVVLLLLCLICLSWIHLQDSPTAQSHLTRRRHSTSIISRPPPNQVLYLKFYV